MKTIESYSPKELSAELQIPYRTILKAIKNNEIKCQHYSPRFRRIRSEEAARWVQSVTK